MQQWEVVTLRVKVVLAPAGAEEQEIAIPLDFRRHFISFIKQVVGGSPIYHRFDEEKPGYSPYVFSVNFKQIVSMNTPIGQMTVKTPVFMTFSTGFFEVMTAFCNGAIALKGHDTILGLTVRDVQLMPLKKIYSPAVKFQIVSHAVLRASQGYVDGSNVGEMEESINTHLRTRFDFLYQQNCEEIDKADIAPVSVLPEHTYRKGVCYHYGGQLTTLQGRIYLTGTPATLQFLYDFGLGVRTGQGFGLLEVVRQL